MRFEIAKLGGWPGRFRPGFLLFVVSLATVANAQTLVTEQSRKLDAFIREHARQHNFDGSVLVQENGGEIYRGSFGIADRAFEVPVKNDTVFRIASITKAFTAVIVLQLYDEGKIDLDKTIGYYLPAYSGRRATGQAFATCSITLRGCKTSTRV